MMACWGYFLHGDTSRQMLGLHVGPTVNTGTGAGATCWLWEERAVRVRCQPAADAWHGAKYKTPLKTLIWCLIWCSIMRRVWSSFRCVLCQCMQLGSTKTETCWKHARASRRQHVRILQNNQNQLPPQSSVQSYSIVAFRSSAFLFVLRIFFFTLEKMPPEKKVES